MKKSMWTPKVKKLMMGDDDDDIIVCKEQMKKQICTFEGKN
jgi:hypothetical protein